MTASRTAVNLASPGQPEFFLRDAWIELHLYFYRFIMGDRAREMTTWTREERCKATCEYYAKLFGTKKALEVTF
jgi:hypothetical protein